MANLKEQEKWEDGVYQIEENDPVLGGENGITNKPIKQLANRTLWLKKTLELFGKKSTPKDLVADSTSTADGFGHSHKLPLASISDKGIVKLNSQTASDSEQDAATPKAVKIAYDKAADAKTAADNAQSSANDGINRANNAQSAANAAQRTANDGVSKANAAQTSANQAKNAADNAQQTANAALPLNNVDSKSVVIGNYNFVFQTDGNLVIANKKTNEVLYAANRWVSKLGDTITGILRTSGIASSQFGFGSYAQQYTSGAPFMVEETNANQKDTYYPIAKGRFRKQGQYGTAVSFGYTTKQGNGDGFGTGITINLVEDNGAVKNWLFQHSGDFVSAGDVKSSSGKSLNTAVQFSDFQYQKIGNFEIRRYPDGTMIQIFAVNVKENQLTTNQMKKFNWAVAFVEKPMVWVTANATDNANGAQVDIGALAGIVISDCTPAICAYRTGEIWGDKNHNPTMQFLAIGRWK